MSKTHKFTNVDLTLTGVLRSPDGEYIVVPTGGAKVACFEIKPHDGAATDWVITPQETNDGSGANGEAIDGVANLTNTNRLEGMIGVSAEFVVLKVATVAGTATRADVYVRFIDGISTVATGITGTPGTDGATGGLAYSNSTPSTVANTTSPTAFTPTYTIPAGTLQVGSVIEIEVWGVYSTDALLAPTIRGKVKFGSTTMIDTGAVTALVGVTNGGWSGRALMVVTSIGAGGTIEAQACIEFSTAATAALLVNAENTAAISVDTTASQAVTVEVTWGTADNDNTITLREMTVKVLKVASIVGATAGGVLSGTYPNPTFNTASVTAGAQTVLAGTILAGPTTSDQTLIGTSFTDVTGLGIAVTSGSKYEFWYYIIATTDATTTGIDLSLNGPTTTTLEYVVQFWSNATTVANRMFSAYDQAIPVTGSNGATPATFLIYGYIVPSASGTLIPRIKREAVGTGPNVLIGSRGQAVKRG